MTKQAEELLIIGNGFDLAAGLETKYESFFKDRYSDEIMKGVEAFKKIRTENHLKEFKALSNVNFWDIYFLLKYLENLNNIDKNWSDIEKDIKHFISDDNSVYYGKAFNKIKCEKVFTNILDESDIKIEGESYYAALITHYILEIPSDKSDFDEFFFLELKKFEEAFKEYIKKEVEKNKTIYTTKSKALLNNLVKDINGTYVLSFNYTELKGINLHEIENVHGKLSNEIIFGIDYEDIKVTNNAFKYSKTYRKLLMNINDSKHSSLPQGIKKIICFGHSLADADYSYFQSIFDFYSIYDSEIRVEFCFSVFKEKYEKQIKNDQLKSITKLLSKYGDTMDNDNHGRNLMHKLLLENRVGIIEVNSDGTRKI